MKKAVGYLRRSTDRQEQSIPNQRRAIERYADSNDSRPLCKTCHSPDLDRVADWLEAAP